MLKPWFRFRPLVFLLIWVFNKAYVFQNSKSNYSKSIEIKPLHQDTAETDKIIELGRELGFLGRFLIRFTSLQVLKCYMYSFCPFSLLLYCLFLYEPFVLYRICKRSCDFQVRHCSFLICDFSADRCMYKTQTEDCSVTLSLSSLCFDCKISNDSVQCTCPLTTRQYSW